jgi:alanine racemase
VVRPDEARALRKAGVRKPILLMGPASDAESEELARADVRLAAFTHQDAQRFVTLARRMGRPVGIHLYVDTGMHRMGMPHDRALAWLDMPGVRNAVRIDGAFTELTEDQDFDRQQCTRLRALADGARAKGLSLGTLHAASSDAIARPTAEAFLDALRPGLALYGGYVTPDAMARAELRPAYRMKARVIRLDRLSKGDGVSYHRRYVAEQDMWTATLSVGHVDGYPGGAAKGCEILIRDRLFPVIGTVSASHTIVALGPETTVQIGDEATLVGPDRPVLHPNVVAQKSGWSEYNMFMHLSPSLVRRVT